MMKTPHLLSHAGPRLSWAFFVLAALLAGGCASEDLTEAVPEGSLGGRTQRDASSGGESGGGGREVPGQDAGSEGEGGGGSEPGGRDIGIPMEPDTGIFVPDTTDPFDPTDAGTSEDAPVLPPAEAGAYTEVAITIPDTGFVTQNGTHFDSDYALNRPDFTCSRINGPSVYADVYRIVTTSTTPITAQVLLRTQADSSVLTLPDGILLLYPGDVTPGGTELCTTTGASQPDATSALASVEVSASAPVLVVVAGLSGAQEGSYALLVGRTGETPPDPIGGGGGGGTDPVDPTDPGCNDSCIFALDGFCDEDVDGFGFGLCDTGTDCSDCGSSGGGGGGGGGGCTDTCFDAFDGYCDDGGPGSDFGICDLGTDCGDCGPR